MQQNTFLLSLMCYIFEKHLSFSECFVTSLGKIFEIDDCGENRSENENIYFNSIIISDGLRTKTNIFIAEDTKIWLEWQRKNENLSETIGAVIVIDDNDTINKYTSTPVIEVKCNISKQLIDKAGALLVSESKICIDYLSKVEKFTLLNLLNRFVIERMESKHDLIMKKHNKLGEIWNSTFTSSLFDCVAISKKRNRKNFNTLALNIGYDTVINQLETATSIEALLFGASGLLKYCHRHDDYTKKLFDEYLILKKRFNIKEMEGMMWDYSSMVKENNLWITIAQLSTILSLSRKFSYELENGVNLKEIYSILDRGTSEYWLTHDTLSGDKTLCHNDRIMSQARKERMVINGFIPFLFAYYKNNSMYEENEKLLEMLENISGEDNKITRKWCGNEKLSNDNALISQSIIQIEKKYCAENRCPQCPIGKKLLR
ncbi:MAG: DUF2851 family protein [Bacteroidetes bacterium]|nr:DUF2851 family protein [Bacteroidota bacterium]